MHQMGAPRTNRSRTVHGTQQSVILWGLCLKMNLRDLKNLRQLDLGHNELKRIPTEIFENLSNLTSFSLENNPLITLESDQFSSFVKLKTLNLMKTSLDDFPPLQTENNVCK